MKKLIYLILLSTTCVVISCADYMQGKIFQPADQKMIDEYIEEVDTDMLSFLRIVDKIGYRGLIHAYGNNTCFIPTNQAIQDYADEIGVADILELPDNELEEFVDFHIIREIISTSEFIDGRLAMPTMYGKYLTTRTVQLEDQTLAIRVNNQANIIQKDIEVGNGLIHKVDKVLLPNPYTVGEMIEMLPDDYDLFKSIMRESSLIDSLTVNKKAGQWFTVLLQSNQSFETAGINDRDDLIAKLEKVQADYKGQDSLLIDLYARYHVIDRLAYVADLSLSSSELTLAENQVISFKVKMDSLIVNEYRSLTKFERGISVNKDSEWTDYSCYNGVLIDLAGYIQPVKRGPEAVYWEITDQPEVKRLKEYRKIGSSVTFKPGELSELAFGGKNNPTISYKVDAYAHNSQYVNGDYFEFSTLRPEVMQWVEIKTPVLTEGVYNVWICWRRGGANNKFKTTFKQAGKDDQVLPNVFDLGEYFSRTTSPEVNLNNGAKQYNAKAINSVVCSRNCGAIQVEYTGRHTLRLDALSGGSQASWWDMIQFIPVDQDQIWPRFDYGGNAIYPCTPCEEIYPYDQPCAFFNDDPCN